MKIDRSTLLGLFALLLWSATVALARRSSESIGPLTTGACVYLSAGVFAVTHWLFKGGVAQTLRAWPRAYVFGCGTLFVVNNVTLFMALGLATGRQQALEVGLVNYLWPTLTLLLSVVLLDRRASMWLVPGTGLALVGVFLVLTHGASVSWGSFCRNLLAEPVAYGLALVAAVSWAFYSNLTHRWGGGGKDGAVPLFMLATGIAMLIVRLLRPEAAAWSGRVVAEVGFLGMVTAMAYVFWDGAMRKGDVVLVAACSYLTPFLSTVVSCVYLGVLPGVSLWAGCALLVCGSFLSWWSISNGRAARS